MASFSEDRQAVEDFIADINRDADEAVDRLEAIASVPFQIWVDFATTPPIELDKAPTVTNRPFPELEKVPFDVSIGEFDPNAYQMNVYDSAYFEFQEPYLIEQIEAGGPGISQAVQDALFNDQAEADLQAMNDGLDAARANYGRRGFPLPTQVMRGQENDIIKKYQDVKANRARETVALLAERATDFIKSALNVGTSMEEARMRFALGMASQFNQITDSLISKFKAEQEARVVEFKGDIDVILAELTVNKTNAEIDVTFQNQLLKQWEVESSQAIEKTKALIQQGAQATSVKLEAAKTLAEYYRTVAAGASNQLSSLSASIETEEVTSP